MAWRPKAAHTQLRNKGSPMLLCAVHVMPTREHVGSPQRGARAVAPAGEGGHAGTAPNTCMRAVARLGSALVDRMPWGQSTPGLMASPSLVGTWGHRPCHRPSCPHSVYRQLVSQWGLHEGPNAWPRWLAILTFGSDPGTELAPGRLTPGFNEHPPRGLAQLSVPRKSVF